MINVMLIDDHPVVRAGLQTILESHPDIHVIATGSSGADAINSDLSDVDVVVMDIQMPGIDGIAATREIDAPVLILTTYDTQANIVAALEAGALGYLLKDAPVEELHRAVVATAAGRRTLSPEVATALAARVASPEVALTPREIEIVRALETGATNGQLAQQLFISVATVKTHLLHIYQKLGVESRTAAVTEARRLKLI